MFLQELLIAMIFLFVGLCFIIGIPMACFNYAKEELIGNYYLPKTERIGGICFHIGLTISGISLGVFIIYTGVYKILF